MKKILLAILLVFNMSGYADVKFDNPFMFGAQLFIEPGQTPQMIDGWFKTMSDNGMTLCRIRMFERYLYDDKQRFEPSLFDTAFSSAERHGVKICATLSPENSDIGGFKMPYDNNHLDSIRNYIKDIVNHFSSKKALLSWVITNEPGTEGCVIPQTPYTLAERKAWNDEHPNKRYNNKGYPLIASTNDHEFLMDLNTNFLKWLSSEVTKYDQKHDIHVNSHAIFENVAQYDFPSWRGFLSSLGASAHPSWHYGYFDRKGYTVALMANSSIINSGAGEMDWLMTELQGGNNTFSGKNPICPTPEEITQWLWTIKADGGKGVIFWLLNPRSSGIEAGEWAMLDYKGRPTDRISAVAGTAKSMNDNSKLLSTADYFDSGIDILYIRESMWSEKVQSIGGDQGRMPGAGMKSALTYFETLAELGLNASLREIGEYDFSKKDYSGKSLIIANQIAIPSKYNPLLEQFVERGGTLLFEGLSGYYDQNMVCNHVSGFPLQKLFGAALTEYKVGDKISTVNYQSHILPVHLWQGYLELDSAKPIIESNGIVLASSNDFGRGRAIWFPSLVGLGCRLTNDRLPLANLLKLLLTESISRSTVGFDSYNEDMVMRSMQSGDRFISVIINKSESVKCVGFNKVVPDTQNIIFSNKGAFVRERKLIINPEETVVICWR